ncbi:MAG: IS21 family transposase [Actinomycetota bacterium]|nr:IS21 family transposase [Actinomycetota bacterium]
MKSREEIMFIVEAFDLTQSYRDAGELAGVDHHTVAHWVTARAEGHLDGVGSRRPKIIDAYLDKVEEWVERSKGKVRADVAHDKLVALGYVGSERTTRRAVAAAKTAYRAGNRRVHRPWVPEPGQWFQWDYGTGPVVAGVEVILFCAWLAWSRFRVVAPILDKTLPTVALAIDRALRAFGGVPTYGLTDNERTVSVDHVAGIAVRNADIVALSGHYGLTVATCVPADPASKGGSESTVKLAKADLVPTDANLLGAYPSFAAVEAACEAFMAEVNSRPHRVTRRAPVEMLGEERSRLHRLPGHPWTVAFGHTRTVGTNEPMVAFEGGSYSVPDHLAGQVVWVRRHGEAVVVVHVGDAGPVEVARHRLTTPGNPRVDDAHFPPAPEGALARTPRPRTAEEVAFLSLGEGAALWLVEAAAAGTGRVRAKMADAVALARLGDAVAVDRALGEAALLGRFAEGDLAAIVAHRAAAGPGEAHAAGEDRSLAQGTKGWKELGR